MSYSEENGQVATKEHPILFSGEMVRAILEGRKTQTRRVVKAPQPQIVDVEPKFTRNAWGFWHDEHYPVGKVVFCPYGQPGDRLWVRETFQPLFAEGIKFRDADWRTGKGYAIRYVATDGRTDWLDPDDSITDRCKPGIHMPRWASRLTLEITKVRVERVQEISESDALAEGVNIEVRENGALEPFRQLWNSINAKRGFGWDANPWVWVIEFQRKS